MSVMTPRSKVILWIATTHAAKDLSTVTGSERMIGLGSYIHCEFERRAFAVGFSAYSGSCAFARQPAQRLRAAPGDSIEGMAFANNRGDLRYFDVSDLRTLGARRPERWGSASS